MEEQKPLNLESQDWVAVEPLPRAELGAPGPGSSVEKRNNCCDLSSWKRHPERVRHRTHFHPSCRVHLSFFPSPAQSLFRPGPGPALGLPVPCGTPGPGAPLHRKSVCAETSLARLHGGAWERVPLAFTRILCLLYTQLRGPTVSQGHGRCGEAPSSPA